MAKTRQTPRYEPDITKVKVVAKPISKEEFENELKAFWSWTSDRTRLRTNWYQSLMEYANMNFHQCYDKEMK